jgi:hypothetical protein
LRRQPSHRGMVVPEEDTFYKLYKLASNQTIPRPQSVYFIS